MVNVIKNNGIIFRFSFTVSYFVSSIRCKNLPPFHFFESSIGVRGFFTP